MGALSDKFGARPIVVIGSCLLASGLALTSKASSLSHFILFFGLIGGCGAGSIYSPLAATLSRWFKERRGMALGIFSAGIGVGTLAFSPFSHLLISTYNWRHAYLILAVVVGSLMIGCSLLIRNDPESMGLFPDGRSNNNDRKIDSVNDEQYSLRRALSVGRFWVLLLVTVISFFSVFVIMVHLVPIIKDRGADGGVGAGCLAVIGMISVLGRFVMGAMGDKRSPEALLGVALFIQGSMILYLIFADSIFDFYLFSAVFAVGYGGTVPLLALVTAKQFGQQSMGTIYGALQFIGIIAGAGGPAAAGFLYDVTGSYGVILFFCGMASLTGAYFSIVLKGGRGQRRVIGTLRG
jgi:MFS family permease